MNADHCHGVVTRDGIEDDCGKPPTSIIDDPEGGPWPACTYHAHRYGNGRVVPLAQIVAQARRDGAAEVVARVEALMHPERGMGVSAYGDGRRFFEEADLRAALASDTEEPTP